MTEYIEREAYYQQINNLSKGKHGVYCAAINDCMNALDEQPAADAVEVRHGKWVSASKKQGVNIGMKCSLCGSRIKYSEFFNGNHNYCHKCGAKMDGKGGTE